MCLSVYSIAPSACVNMKVCVFAVLLMTSLMI
jgi:hypothetical protein